MKERHWDRMTELCNYTFDIESETFNLASVMEAPLLEHKDEVEVLFPHELLALNISTLILLRQFSFFFTYYFFRIFA